ncbi:hypothetical protein ABW19_dt0210526 [Dactylella cylindrospora]|nr:hypothetical protein ABW19_dt0210526 [Dactylella cylindrospora]
MSTAEQLATEDTSPDSTDSEEEKDPRVLREAGRLEQFHITRYNLKMYNNVVVSASYSSPHELTPDLLLRALHPVLSEHPVLSAGILNSKTAPASYVRLPELQLGKVIFDWSKSDTANSHYREYAALIERLHNTRFGDIENEPLWKIAVLKRSYHTPTAWDSETNAFGRIDYEILFCYHHGIGDGLSGAAFHYSLLKALNGIQPGDSDIGRWEVYTPPEKFELLPSMDENIDLGLGLKTAGKIAGFIGKGLLPSFLKKTVWTGKKPVPLEMKPSRVAMTVVDDYTTTSVLKTLKSHKVSMTAFIAYAAASTLWDASKSFDKEEHEKMKAVKVSIPVSFRKHAGFSRDVIVDCVSAVQWDIEKFKNLAGETSGMRKLTEALKSGAETTRDSEVGLLKIVSDYEKFMKEQLGKPRDLTFEVSNLGVLDDTKLGLDPKDGKGTYTATTRKEMKEAEWRIDEAIFSQSASVAGPAFTVNVATVRGKMVIVVQWMEGVMEDDMMKMYTKAIEGKIFGFMTAKGK